MPRVNRWLWEGQGVAARAGRVGLAPLAAGFSATLAARAAAYRSGWLRTHRLPIPAVSVGNLSLGGSGKTPLAAWMARFFLEQGIRPAILLRGYGGDEGQLHREMNPGALVLEGADRYRTARAAAAAGAEVLVMDDAFQRLDVSRDLNVVLIATESLEGSRATFPAGPWREGWRALARADLLVMTRKRCTLGEAESKAGWVMSRAAISKPVAVARLSIDRLSGLFSGHSHRLSELSGIRVIASAGIGDPATFGAQLEQMGARVDLYHWPDHHRYRPADVARLIWAAGDGGRVVTTGKDAVKLRRLWPAGFPEPLVAELGVQWEIGAERVAGELRTLTSSRRREPVKS